MAKFDSKTFNPEAFGKYVDTVPKLRKNELIKSRAIVPNASFKQIFAAQTGTQYALIPLFGRIGGVPLNYDGSTDITAQKTRTFERGVIVVGRAQAWVETDFAEDITGGAGFMSNVGNQVSDYWDEVDQDTLLSILKGVFAMTGTANLNFVDNHTYDIVGATDPMVGPTTLNTAIQQAAGDKKANFTISIMHSNVATNLENLKLLKYMTYTDANGVERPLTLASWNGRAVLIDDSMPIEVVPESVAGANDGYTKYTTYVLGNGAFDYADIGAKVPYEMDRDPAINGGQDTLYSRQRKAFAPAGISFTKSAMASNSPTVAELEKGANWTLVNDGGVGANRLYYDHKAIAISRIISRG